MVVDVASDEPGARHRTVHRLIGVGVSCLRFSGSVSCLPLPAYHSRGAGRNFIRGNAPSVKRIEVYTAAKNGTLALAMCKDSNSAPIPCKENKISPKTVTAYMTGGGTLQFHWSKGGKDGLIMISPTQMFQQNASNEFQLSANVDAQQNPISLEKIEFVMDGVKQEFARPADGRLAALLCPNPADDHCALPKPKP